MRIFHIRPGFRSIIRYSEPCDGCNTNIVHSARPGDGIAEMVCKESVVSKLYVILVLRHGRMRSHSHRRMCLVA